MTNLEYLFHLERHGIKLGLDNIRRLLETAGRPERSFPSVHVAGTNGKGSVVALLASMAQAAGYKVARFTSPHLIDLSERFMIGSQPIEGGQLDAHIGFFRRVADQMDPPPTFFELTTAVAFRWFAESEVDLAVVEVGMGGRLDSTNVLKPLVSAITTVDLDHTRFLGDTLEQIAFEKAGIMKPRTPVVIGERKHGPLEVLLERARELRCPVRLLGRDFAYTVSEPPFDQKFEYEGERLRLGPAHLGLCGSYQGQNAAVAVAVAEQLHRALPRLDARTIERGLEHAHWPCRMERVLNDPPVIIDVAHNPAGARKLAEAMRNCVTILAMSSDKDARAVIEILAPATKSFIFTRFQGERSSEPQDLAALAGALPHQIEPSLGQAIAKGLAMASDDSPLLITGSIFAAGEARKILIEQHRGPGLVF